MKMTEKITGFAKRKIARPSSLPANKISASALRKELDLWLAMRTIWNHDDWLNLLSELRRKGYNDLIDTPKGQEAIGLYLESNKKDIPSC